MMMAHNGDDGYYCYDHEIIMMIMIIISMIMIMIMKWWVVMTYNDCDDHDEGD